MSSDRYWCKHTSEHLQNPGQSFCCEQKDTDTHTKLILYLLKSLHMNALFICLHFTYHPNNGGRTAEASLCTKLHSAVTLGAHGVSPSHPAQVAAGQTCYDRTDKDYCCSPCGPHRHQPSLSNTDEKMGGGG